MSVSEIMKYFAKIVAGYTVLVPFIQKLKRIDKGLLCARMFLFTPDPLLAQSTPDGGTISWSGLPQQLLICCDPANVVLVRDKLGSNKVNNYYLKAPHCAKLT